MEAPWIEREKYQDPEFPTGQVPSDAAWQALFACQVEVPPHQEWVKNKWGFNAMALFDEAQERQRLFLESQYTFPDEFGMEAADRRTLAYRFIHRPGEGLLVVVIGKIHARTEEKARENALSYYREVKSIFPYDYTLAPAQSRDEFLRLCGWEILEADHPPSTIAQIKRMEYPIYLKENSPCLQGFWRSGPRAHEQIWRSIAGSSGPLLMNVSLRSTVLFDDEREAIVQSTKENPGRNEEPLNQLTSSALKIWNQKTFDRRLASWKKFFYLQVHLVSTQKLNDNLFRTIGTSLALHSKGESLPGYMVVLPYEKESPVWQRKIQNLDIIQPASFLPEPRLSEVADLEEAFDVMQIPYSPPENGFPDLEFNRIKK